MTIKLKEYGFFNFTRNLHYDSSTNESYETSRWSAVKIIDNIEIDFNFSEYMFPNRTIDWSIIQSRMKNLDGEIKNYLPKSKEILNALHFSIFNKHVSDLNAYFLLDEIQLIGMNGIVEEKHDSIIGTGINYKFGFILESIDDEMALLDPYQKYYVYFSHRHLSGAYRG